LLSYPVPPLTCFVSFARCQDWGHVMAIQATLKEEAKWQRSINERVA